MPPEFYRKRPVTVEAIQWDGSEKSQSEIVTWSQGRVSGWFDGVYFLKIETIDSVARADVGDWVIKGTHGEFYPCKPDIFAETYIDAFAPDPACDLLLGGIEAMRLTREYVGEGLLPQSPGWRWYDWTRRAEEFLFGGTPQIEEIA